MSGRRSSARVDCNGDVRMLVERTRRDELLAPELVELRVYR
jgi:hypothetical protein